MSPIKPKLDLPRQLAILLVELIIKNKCDVNLHLRGLRCKGILVDVQEGFKMHRAG